MCPRRIRRAEMSCRRPSHKTLPSPKPPGASLPVKKPEAGPRKPLQRIGTGSGRLRAYDEGNAPLVRGDPGTRPGTYQKQQGKRSFTGCSHRGANGAPVRGSVRPITTGVCLWRGIMTPLTDISRPPSGCKMALTMRS
jgi:hypothetical protein